MVDNNISRGLELGVAFLVFVAGLGAFYATNSTMASYLNEAFAYQNQQAQFSEVVSGGSGGTGGTRSDSSSEIVTKAELLFILTNGEPVDIYINGSHYTKLGVASDGMSSLSGYEAMVALKAALAALPYSAFEGEMVIDGDGALVAVHYQGIY